MLWLGTRGKGVLVRIATGQAPGSSRMTSSAWPSEDRRELPRWMACLPSPNLISRPAVDNGIVPAFGAVTPGKRQKKGTREGPNRLLLPLQVLVLRESYLRVEPIGKVTLVPAAL